MLKSAGGSTALWGIIASLVLAFASLAGGIYQLYLLTPLVTHGTRADAEIIEIDTGVKGGRRAILRFVTGSGDTVVSRDMFEMMLFRFDKGERVNVLYDSADPSRATIDLGAWIWHQPAFFLAGFVVLSALCILLARSGPPRDRQ